MMKYNEYPIKKLEDTILLSYNGPFKKHHNYTDEACLLELRKDILNHYALRCQAELLPTIVEFNDTLRSALQEMYERAHYIWNDIKDRNDYDEFVRLTAECYLSDDYPQSHPVQGEDRQRLWEAICDSGWNSLYKSGVTQALVLPFDLEESFESFIGMNCTPPNCNEGLDRELTKDLQLINAFHNLFDHTNFALTDFIYVRKFNTEIKIEINK